MRCLGVRDACVDLVSGLKTSHDTQVSPPFSLLVLSALGLPWTSSWSRGLRFSRHHIFNKSCRERERKKSLLLCLFHQNIKIFRKRCDQPDCQLIPSAALITLIMYPQGLEVITWTTLGSHYSTYKHTVKPKTIIMAQQNKGFSEKVKKNKIKP